MGTSIILYVEVYDEKKQEWIADEQLKLTGRNYILFAALADVRNQWGIIPIQSTDVIDIKKDAKDVKEVKEKKPKYTAFVQKKLKDGDEIHSLLFKDCGPGSKYWDAFEQCGNLCFPLEQWKNSLKQNPDEDDDKEKCDGVLEEDLWATSRDKPLMVITAEMAAEFVKVDGIDVYVSSEQEITKMQEGLKHQTKFAEFCAQVMTKYPKTLPEYIRFVFAFC
jgi:hypothetical protein